MTETPEDVQRVASDIDWDDLMLVGFDSDGRCIILSSRIGCADALLLTEMLKQSVLAEAFATRPKHNA